MGSNDFIDATEYNIMDVGIFQTGVQAGESNVYSSFFPDESTQNKFKDILGFVSDYNTFKDKTYFEKILTLDIKNQYSSDYFQTTDRSRTEQCIGGTENFTWLNDNSQFSTNNINGSGSNLDLDIVNQIEEDMRNNMNSDEMLLTKGDKDGVKKYKDIIKNICKEIFKHQYAELRDESGTESFTIENDSKIDNEINKMTTYIDEQVRNNRESFIRECTDEKPRNTYYGDIVAAMYEYQNNGKFEHVKFSNISPSAKEHEEFRFFKLFLIIFYPYFVFNYIINSIALEDVNPLTHQQSPRYFFFQRMTVLSCYIFMYYTLLTIFDNLSQNSTKTHIIEAITELNDHILFKERIPDETLSYHMMQEKSEQTRDSSLQMQQLGHTVSLLKTNLNKAAVYDARLGPILRNAKIHVILASLLMVITIVGALVLMFIPQFGPQTFWIFLIVVIVISVVTFFYSLFRKAMR